MKIETSTIRAEFSNGYCFVRNLGEKGGVIDALVPAKKEKEVSEILSNVGEKTFSEIWSELILLKKVRFSFSSN